MSHFSAYVPSLPAMHYLMTEVFGATKTRHLLDRKKGAEWVDYINHDWMGDDQVSWHIPPELKTEENHYTIEQIEDPALGKAELIKYLEAPSKASAVVGTGAVAPMPHWGPVFTKAQFQKVVDKLRDIGVDPKAIKPEVQHAGQDAEHAAMFLTLGGLAIEVKGYNRQQDITANLVDPLKEGRNR